MSYLIPSSMLEQWRQASKLRAEFYKEKQKVDILLQEALCLCNNIAEFQMKKSIVRSKKR